jgi:hypothetical protein
MASHAIRFGGGEFNGGISIMAQQEITMMTEYIGAGTDADPYRLTVFDDLGTGESASDETGTPSDSMPLANNSGIARVFIDENDVAALETAASARAIWRRYTDGSPGGVDPDSYPTSEEITALRNWIENKYGYTATQIANWFGTAPVGLENWLLNHTWREFIQEVKVVWRQFN